MAQADGVVANGTGAAVRSDLNGQLAALFTNHSGSTSPGTTYAHQFWADTNENVLKIRNSANDGWITLRELDGTMLIEDGSAATPGLAFADDVNTGIFSPAADAVAFSTGGTERVRITSTGAIAIEGASNYGSSGQILTSNGDDAPTWQDAPSSISDKIEEGNTNVECVDTGSDGHILFDTEGSERARIDNSGRFLLGTNTSSGFASARAIINSAGSSATESGNLVLQRGEANGSISNGDAIGNLSFADESGYTYATISANADLAPGTDSPGRLVFSTTADGASSATERLRIDSSGIIFLGNSSSTENTIANLNQAAKAVIGGGGGGSGTIEVFGGSHSGNSKEIHMKTNSVLRFKLAQTGEQQHFGTNTTNLNIANSASAGNSHEFLYCQHSSTGLATGTNSFRIATDGDVFNTNNSYGSLSDQRLKENIVDATSQWDDIKDLQVRKYNFREDTGHETHTQLGLIAQEVESVSPGLVETTDVREGETVLDADGNQLESIKSINYSVLYMKAVKALQEAQTRIEALETQNTAQQATIDDLLARVTALESA